MRLLDLFCGAAHNLEPSRVIAYADAMGCDWMTAREAREAIPPAYTEHIGGYLMAELMARAA